MKGMGIDINEGINGVDVPHNVHVYTYTDAYDEALYNRLKNKLTPESFRAELDEVFKLLADGRRIDVSEELIP
jgi:hypothetical protein